MSRFHLPAWLARKQSPAALCWLLIGMLLLIIGSLALAYAVISPVLRGNDKKAQVALQQQQVAVLQHDRDRLLKRKQYLNSAEGVSDKAHEIGMVRQGEEIVRFPPDKSTSTTPVATAKDDADARVRGLLFAGLLLFALAFLIGTGLLFHRWRKLRARRPAGMLTPRSELRKRKRPMHDPVHER